jgi:putative sigma-54 modulation protein
MQVAVTFRHMETSPALRDYASRKLDHVVNKYVRSAVDAKVVLSVEKYWHIAKITLQVRGLKIKSEEKSEDMYSSVDLALDKLERQLKRYKDRIRNHKPVRGVPKRQFGFEVIAPVNEEDDSDPREAEEQQDEDGQTVDFMDVQIASGGKEGEETRVTVIERQLQHAEPMTVAEAIMQLDLKDTECMVFTRADTQTISVLYHQKDGNYALINTAPDDADEGDSDE